jgi:hypothetical protein
LSPNASAAAAAARAFSTLWRPCIGSLASASPEGVLKTKRLSPTPTASTPKAITSADPDSP